MSEFTSGPWKACLNVPTAAIPGHIIKADNEAETPIASLWVGGGTHGVERQVANARLIAAAPDMYAQLENLHMLLEEAVGYAAFEVDELIFKQAIKDIETLLAKARGEAQQTPEQVSADVESYKERFLKANPGLRYKSPYGE